MSLFYGCLQVVVFLLLCRKKKGNHSDLCVKCKSKYESLNVLYGHMEKNRSLCIDIEDAVRISVPDNYQMAPFLFSSFPFKDGPKLCN